MEASTTEPEPRPHRHLAAWASGAVLAGLVACYWSLADAVYGITIWPAWVWLGFGLPSAAFAWRRARRWGSALALAWLGFVCTFAEEPRSILNQFAAPLEFRASEVTVISLNCAGGDPLAAAEAVARSPSLILFQESPPARELREVVGAGWSLVVGPDASIAAKGRLEAIPIPRWTSNFVAARWWRARTIDPVYVVSLRLAPPVLRFDYWNPACWRAYADGKRRRRIELDALSDFLDTLPADVPIIVGGDFNTPPDASLQERLFGQSFRDSFTQSGQGWGATAINDYPMVRIDQIWVSMGFSTSTRALKTQYSDHRMVLTRVVLMSNVPASRVVTGR